MVSHHILRMDKTYDGQTYNIYGHRCSFILSVEHPQKINAVLLFLTNWYFLLITIPILLSNDFVTKQI